MPSGGDLGTGTVKNGELSEMIRKQEIGGFFNVKGIKKICELQRIAVEANANSVCWTFSPMVDICRNARWGRIAEGNGEDPYLGSLFTKAYIRDYQGENMKKRR